MADFYDEQDGPDQWTPDPTVALTYKRRKQHARHTADWRMEMRESFEYRAGEQWDSEDKARLEEQNRPIATFNRIAPIIDSVVGWEINNSQQLTYRPRTLDDAYQGEVYTETARWVMDGCDGEHEETDAYSDAITCGMGWTEWRVDYEEDPDGKLLKERVPPNEMRWDPGSRKQNLIDKRWVMREKRWPLEDIRDRWPDKADQIDWTPSYLEDDAWLEEHDASRAWQYEQDQSWNDQTRQRDNKALVIHHQWRDREPYYRVGDPETGRIVEFDEERFGRVRQYVEERGIAYVRQQRWVYKQAFVCGKVLLEEGRAPIDDGFSYDCITGKRDEQHSIWYGLHRAMKDPQRWANAFFSTAMHTMMSNAKGGLIIEEGAVDDLRSLQENWARPEGIVTVEDGALAGGRLQERSFGGYPPGLDKLMAFAISSIRDCTGINLELLGMADRDQPNVLEMERKRAALTILSPLVASLQRYRVNSGRALLSFMRAYVPDGTLVRVTGKPVTFSRDAATVKYDVIVDTAPNSPNLKQEVWGTLSQLVPSLVKAGVPVPPALLRYSPLPESVAEEWIAYIEGQGGVPPELQQQMEQMTDELGKLQQENVLLKAKREEHFAKLQQDREMHALDMQREMERVAVDKYKIEMEAATREAVTDRDRLVKLAEIQAEFEAEMAKINAQADVQRENNEASLQQQREQNVVQLENERAKRDLEREMAEKEETAPFKDRVEKVEEMVEQQAKEAEQRRAIVYEFLASRGGEVAEVVAKLKAADGGD